MYGDLKSQTHFKGHCHCHLWSPAVDPLLAQTKLIHLAYSQMGHRSIPFQFMVLLWLGSNAQTLLKAETGDHAPAGRKKALAQSPSKSLLMSETCQKSQCSLIVPIIPVWLWMQPLYLPTWTRLLLSPKWQTELVGHVEYVTQISKFCDPLCVTEICYQWWLLF